MQHTLLQPNTTRENSARGIALRQRAQAPEKSEQVSLYIYIWQFILNMAFSEPLQCVVFKLYIMRKKSARGVACKQRAQAAEKSEQVSLYMITNPKDGFLRASAMCCI